MVSEGGAAVRGALAGAMGTAALNATTYLDMAVRGRPESTTPQETAARLASMLGVPLPDDEGERHARLTGAGAVLGFVAGTGTGVALGLIRARTGLRGLAPTTGTAWLLAMAVGNGPMTVLGITDPRRWTAVDWAADVVPHLAFAVTAASTLRALDRD